MSIQENHYFTHPRALDSIRAELQHRCPGSTTGLSLTSAGPRAHGHLCVPGEGAAGVWVDREAAPAGELWTRAAFYTVYEDGIYVEEIAPVGWSNSEVTDQAAAWLRNVQRGAKDEHRIQDQSTGDSADRPSA